MAPVVQLTVVPSAIPIARSTPVLAAVNMATAELVTLTAEPDVFRVAPTLQYLRSNLQPLPARLLALMAVVVKILVALPATPKVLLGVAVRNMVTVGLQRVIVFQPTAAKMDAQDQWSLRSQLSPQQQDHPPLPLLENPFSASLHR